MQSVWSKAFFANNIQGHFRSYLDRQHGSQTCELSGGTASELRCTYLRCPLLAQSRHSCSADECLLFQIYRACRGLATNLPRLHKESGKPLRGDTVSLTRIANHGSNPITGAPPLGHHAFFRRRKLRTTPPQRQVARPLRP
jgi:hypothetical protein